MIMKMPLNNSLQSIVSYTYMVVIPALDILRSMTKFKVRKYLIVLTSLWDWNKTKWKSKLFLIINISLYFTRTFYLILYVLHFYRILCNCITLYRIWNIFRSQNFWWVESSFRSLRLIIRKCCNLNLVNLLFSSPVCLIAHLPLSLKYAILSNVINPNSKYIFTLNLTLTVTLTKLTHTKPRNSRPMAPMAPFVFLPKYFWLYKCCIRESSVHKWRHLKFLVFRSPAPPSSSVIFTICQTP